MVRKIFKAGNSLVVTLPKESLKELKLQEGSEVSIVLDQVAGRLIIEPVTAPPAEITAEFAEQLDRFIEQYRSALEALAR